MNESLPQWHDLQNLVPPHCASILDIGCGNGQTLTLCPNIAFRAGVDTDQTAIEEARKTVPDAEFHVAKAEHLPFQDASFDAAVSSVALPYVNIPMALKECARVLRRDGVFCLSVHTWDFINHLWRRSKPNLAGRVFRVYVTINGLSLQFTGKVFPYPLKPTVMESFQTRSAMRHALAVAGFHDIQELPRRVPSFIAYR